jgi:predicted PurR-regulated permease PerM
MAQLRNLLPRRIEPVIVGLARESDEVLGAFLRGQFVVMLALGGIYSLGLFIIGLDFSLLIGMLAGLVSFVPYLGLIVGIVVAGIAALIQFQEFWPLLPVIGVFGIGQLIEGMLLTPLLVGDRIGLHPVAVIFAVLVGGHLFGFFGVLLALPVAAIIMVLLRHTHDEYLNSVLYHD